MKSQTLQSWLHASAPLFASVALISALSLTHQDSSRKQDRIATNGSAARESPAARVSHAVDGSYASDRKETAVLPPSSKSNRSYDTRRALIEFHLSKPLVASTTPEEITQTPPLLDHRADDLVDQTDLTRVESTDRTIDAVYRKGHPEAFQGHVQPPLIESCTHTSQWLKGDGFIIGWDGLRCITAGEVEQPLELSTAMAILTAIAPRNRSDIALASYSERPNSESSYEDSDLWESDQDSSGNTGSGGASGAVGSKQPDAIGVPPPRPQPQFLRDTSVLLDPGEFQFEYGVSYTTNLQTTAIGVNVDDNTVVTSLRTLTRTASVPMEFRVGCRNDVQAFVSLPFGYNLQQISIANTADSSDGVGIGDLTFGMSRVLRKPQAERFTVLGNVSASAPTGLAQLSNIQQVPGVALGSGYWTLSGGLVFIRTIDPIAAFIGVNYVQTFETMLNNLDLEPGNIFSYRFGVGYAINSRVTVSSSFNGAYISELEVGGRLIPGSAREPLTVRLAATILSKGPSLVGPAKGRRKTTEPFISMGITDAAPDTSFGVRWTY